MGLFDKIKNVFKKEEIKESNNGILIIFSIIVILIVAVGALIKVKKAQTI